MKIKQNLILVEHRELPWFYWFRRYCHNYFELWKERRSCYTCIGVFCQGCFFKFKAQFTSLFRTQSNILQPQFNLWHIFAAILELECILWVIAIISNRTCPYGRFCQFPNTITNDLNRLCYKTLNFFAE